MGNCQSQRSDGKRSAIENIQILFQNTKQKSPILFVIKEWPTRNTVNLRSPTEAVSRNLELSLYPGEKIAITLKNHKTDEAASKSPLFNNPHGSVVLSRNGIHCQVRRNNQFFQIDFPVQKERVELWRYTRGWNDFSEGDVMRMGLIQYKLCKFVGQNNNQLEDLRKTIHKLHSSNIEFSAPRCRICLSSSDSSDNPLISPCRCEGSIKFTHLKCLSAWLFSSSLNQNQFLIIKTNTTMCQLCKTDMVDTPEFRRMENLLLTNIHDIPAPYGIFQFQQQQVEDNRAKNYLVLCFKAKKNYTLGRKNYGKDEADIAENDIHISKLNTEMRYSNDRLSIRDCDSMHGTLMQVRDPIRLSKANQSEDLAFHNMLFRVSYQPQFDQQDLDVLPEINQNPSTRIV